MALPTYQWSDPQTFTVASSLPALSLNRSDLSATVTFTQTAASTVTCSGIFAATQFNGSGAGLTIPVTSFSTTGIAVIGTDNHCTATSGNYAITLPAASACSGLILLISIDPTSTYLVTVTGNGSDTIDGSNTRIMWANEVAELKSNGTTWTKIGGKSIPMSGTLGVSGNQTFAAATQTLLAFKNSLDCNAPATFQVAASSEFVILRPGRYHVSLNMLLNATNTSINQPQGVVKKNGTTAIGVANMAAYVAASQSSSTHSSGDVTLAVGDYLQPYGYYNTGSYVTTFNNNDSASPAWNFFKVTEIPTW
jgi:hypothetical protein